MFMKTIVTGVFAVLALQFGAVAQAAESADTVKLDDRQPMVRCERYQAVHPKFTNGKWTKERFTVEACATQRDPKVLETKIESKKHVKE